jgi:serine/threonine protein kinase
MTAQPHSHTSPPERDPLDAAAREDLADVFSLESVHRRGPRGESIVYMARDLEYEQRVAVKVMGRRPGDGSAVEEAFHKAAAAAAVLDHPHIVQLYSAGATDRLWWWSMRYVEGRSLAERLRSSGPMDWSACIRIIDDVAAALESAHRLSVVHGDLTPANVLVDAAGHAHVTDFWLPWVIRHGQSPSGVRPGPATDQAALAALVEVCLGKTGAELPPHVERAIARATSHTPAERFPSVLGFRGALGYTTPRPASGVPVPLQLLGYEAMGDVSTHEARWRWVPIAVLTLVVLGAVAAPWLMSSNSPGGQSVTAPAGASGAADEALGRPPAESLGSRPLPAAAAPSPNDSVASVRMAPPSPRVAPVSSLPAPAPAPAPPPSPRPRPRPRAEQRAAPAAEPGRLFINATPWGQVYLDDELLGNTPQVAVPVPPGQHRLRVVRDGFEPYEQSILVAAGQQLRFTDIVLHEVKP